MVQDRLEQRLSEDVAFIRTLDDVQPSRGGRLQPVYDDIQETLRVPLVNYLFRALANWPDYLERAWPALAPGLGSRGLERGTDMLRSAAVLTPPEGDRPDWKRMGDMPAIEAFTDTIHYVLPKLVIVATCLDLELAPEKPEALPDPADRARLPLPWPRVRKRSRWWPPTGPRRRSSGCSTRSAARTTTPRRRATTGASRSGPSFWIRCGSTSVLS